MVEDIFFERYGDFLRVINPDPGHFSIDDDSPVGAGDVRHNQSCGSISISYMTNFCRLNCSSCGTILILPRDVMASYNLLRKWCEKEKAEKESHERAVDDAVSQTARIGSASDKDF